jgi:hypothetical protein
MEEIIVSLTVQISVKGHPRSYRTPISFLTLGTLLFSCNLNSMYVTVPVIISSVEYLREIYFYKQILLSCHRYPHGVIGEDGKCKMRRNAKCRRKDAHILNSFADKINRAGRVQFSPHERVTQEVSSPNFLSFTTFQSELSCGPMVIVSGFKSLLARNMSIRYPSAQQSH